MTVGATVDVSGDITGLGATCGMLAEEAGAEANREGIEPTTVALFATKALGEACGFWAPCGVLTTPPAPAMPIAPAVRAVPAAPLRVCDCSRTASITATHWRIAPVYCGSLHKTARARLMSSRQPNARCEEASPRSKAIGISAAWKR